MSNLNGHTLAVGDGVAVVEWKRSPRLSTVKRVLKSFVELEDGTKWQVDGGRSYPRPSPYDARALEYPVMPAHHKAIRRRFLSAYMHNQEWNKLPLEVLERLNNLLRGTE